MVFTKVCGISNPGDAREAADAGADAIGMIFAESPREVNVDEARRISVALPDGVLKVGVFVDAEPEEVLETAREVGLDLAQLHGDETPETVAAIRGAGLPIMKALRVRNAEALAEIQSYEADLIMLDAWSARARGGTGETFDWGLAKSVKGRDNIVVSGGLTPENVREAIEFFEPYGVDASSSLEEKPGKKSGERYVPETLIHALEELEEAYERYRNDPEFVEELDALSRDFVGRPTPLMFAERLTKTWGGANVWFKREDLAHTGAHKINNALGQILLADRMGKRRIIAETGAGQHGVATATVAALYGKECLVYMGEEDTRRQRPNVVRMKLLGAEVVPVMSGSRTLKAALNEAIRDWVTNVEDTHYIIGTVAGPAPYPRIVRDLQTIIGRELEAQARERFGGDPNAVVACVGGGSNAIGAFYPFIGREGVHLVGVEAAGRGLETGKHGASLTGGRPGVLHGNLSYVLQTEEGQIREAHSISAGLDYPSVGPEHAYLKDSGLAEYASATDEEALEAFTLCSRLEGIIPALETAHAIFYAEKVARELGPGKNLVVNLSGRGDKDVEVVAEALGVTAEEADEVSGDG